MHESSQEEIGAAVPFAEEKEGRAAFDTATGTEGEGLGKAVQDRRRVFMPHSSQNLVSLGAGGIRREAGEAVKDRGSEGAGIVVGRRRR